MRRATATVLSLACTTVLMTACGQKGPLTLPDKHAAVVTPAPATPATTPAATPADKPKDKDTDSQPPQ